MNQDLIKKLNEMSEEQIEALMNEQVPAELEKQAQDEMVANDFAQALYVYGQLMAQSEMKNEEELSKEASAEETELMGEVAAVMEEGFKTLILGIEDAVELQKEAAAAADFIIAGYENEVSELLKEAAKSKEPSPLTDAVKNLGQAVKNKALDFDDSIRRGIGGAALITPKAKQNAVDKARVHLAKNYGKYAGGTAALGAAGLLYSKMKKKEDMKKTASLEDVAELQMLHAEIEKIAAAKKKADKGMMSELATKASDKMKEIGAWASKNKGKAAAAGAGAAAAVGAAGYGLKKYLDKKKENQK